MRINLGLHIAFFSQCGHSQVDLLTHKKSETRVGRAEGPKGFLGIFESARREFVTGHDIPKI